MKSFDADAQQDRSGDSQKQELGPQDHYSYTLEKDSPHDDQEVGERVDISDPTHHEWYVVDGKDES
jgi:hypothetical protein